jgi:tetratricopeptide (TPR) repeat protein
MKEPYMKNVFVTVVLAFAIGAAGQQPTQSAQPGQTQSGATPAPTPVPTNQKVIKDPAEYNAYIAALNIQDPAQKAAAMEAFVKQYPQSIVLPEALEQALSAYQLAGNQAKIEETARRILQLTPNDLHALAIVVALDRIKATNGDAPALKEMCTDSQTGVQALPGWQKPGEMADADFQKLRTQMTNIFNGAAGFCALQSKNYAQARDFYTKAFEIEPNNLQDVYQLAVAYLEMNPIDLNGLWYCSKAMQLAQGMNNAQAVNGMQAYCKSKYKKFHGGDDGWEQVVSSAAPQKTLPGDFAQTIKPAPTPCDLAVQVVQQNDPGSLSFGDKEFILSKAACSPANKDAADKVWKNIQDTEKGGEARLKIPVKVISTTKDSIEAALSEDNQTANKVDLHVTMEKPMLHPPAAGTMTDIIGVITNYTPDPFLFTMEHGELPAPAKPPVHHPVRRNPS